jgi:hypothetical protein
MSLNGFDAADPNGGHDPPRSAGTNDHDHLDERPVAGLMLHKV